MSENFIPEEGLKQTVTIRQHNEAAQLPRPALQEQLQ